MLHGRDRERARLDGMVDDLARGAGGALQLCGPAGIGKTALLEHAAGRAAEAGAGVVRACGHEAEADIPYAALHDLVAPLLHRLDLLAPAQRDALAGAFGVEPGAAPAERFAVPVATLALLGAVADERPLLLIADDLHWTDEASRETLLFVARHAAGAPLAVLGGAREEGPLPEVERLDLGPLDPDGARAVLADAAPLAAEVADRLLEAGAGNPLALRELPRGLTPDQRAGRAALGAPLAPATAIQSTLARRLEEVPAETRHALCVLAAAASATPDEVAAALDELGPGARALEPAVEAGILTRATSFAHPLFAAAAYHAEPSRRRREAHRAIAAAVADPARRAWHLAAAAAGPDERAAAALAEAALRARARAAHTEAAHAFQRAAELTPDAGVRLGRELEAARELSVAGDHRGAAELAGRVARETEGEPRARAEHLQAHVLLRGGAPAEALELLDGLERKALGDGDATRAAELALEASIAHMQSGDMEALLATAERARGHVGDAVPELAMVAGLVAGEALLALGRAEGDDLIAAAEPLLFGADPRSDLAELVAMGAMCSVWTERFDRAERTLEHLVAGARALGATGRLPYPLCVRSQLHWRAGRWAAAYADAEESVRLSRAASQAGILAVALAALGRAEAGLGRLDAARRHAAEGIALAEASDSDATLLHSLATIGFAELGAGRPDVALEALERADAIDQRLRHGEPAIIFAAGDHVEALLRAGRTADGERVLDRLDARAEATGAAWAHAVAARCRALLVCTGDVEAVAAEALAWHDRVPMPFERARTRLVIGERLRRDRQRAAARPHLQAALEAFEALGADPWAERARAGLRASGVATPQRAPSAVEQLTERELQIAVLVGQGLTNKEVSAAAFLSPKTVEHHLSAIYRKLGLRSRSQLAAVLASQPGLRAA